MSLYTYRRHKKVLCKHRGQRNRCDCPCWVIRKINGRRIRRSLNTRNWKQAKKIAKEMENDDSLRNRFKMPKNYRPNKNPLTIEQRTEQITRQGFRCAICQTTDPGPRGWAYDHCHKTGKPREALCPSCNSVLGFAGDSEAVLLEAALYIRRHRANQQPIREKFTSLPVETGANPPTASVDALTERVA